MSGNLGGSATAVDFIFPGVRVRLLTVYDGKLDPCTFKAVTVTSYMVKGAKSPSTVEFWEPGTLTWTVWRVMVVDFGETPSLGSKRRSSKDFRDVAFIE